MDKEEALIEVISQLMKVVSQLQDEQLRIAVEVKKLKEAYADKK